MVASGTLELAKNNLDMRTSFPLGSLVEVTYVLPDRLRSYTYIGTVAVRPEDNAQLSVTTHKLGGERVIPRAETFIIKTLSKTRHDHLPLEDDAPQQRVSTELMPTDLIFDPNHEDFTIVDAASTVPSPR